MKEDINIPSAPPLPALSLVGSTRFTYTFSRILIVVSILFLIGLFFVPWRQHVLGNGRIIAFDPLERRINVESQLSGRVKTLHVLEGQEVKKDQLIVEIEDNDPLLMQNLLSQKQSVQNREQFAQNKVSQISNQEQQQKLAKANALVDAQERVNAAKASFLANNLEYKRTETLHEKGLASRRDYEQITMKVEDTRANLSSAESILKKTENDFEAILASIRAQKEAAQGSVEAARKELTALDITINQTKRQKILAPRDGIVYKVAVTDGTYLSPGQIICSVIPKTDSRFVELFLDGNDIALIKARTEVDGETIPGSPVRLSFEGWPAIQTIGWPQLAVGTFGGEVVFIDSANDGNGRFRVVVGPDKDNVDRYDGNGKQEIGWPDKDRWLRQGTLTQAWFMLDQVPLWKELWRQMNGFPPLPEGDSIDPAVSGN